MNKNFWRGSKAKEHMYNILSKVGQEFILFDTETTGLRPETDDVIIQLSGFKCKILEDLEFEKGEEINLYINPERKLEKIIVELTGITDELLEKQPTEDEQWEKIREFFGNDVMVCGHNVSFDVRFMKALYERHGDEFRYESMDTFNMAKELHSKNEAGSHKNGDLARYFGLDDGLSFHNSYDDIIATMRLLRFFVDEYKELAESDDAKELEHVKVAQCSAYWPLEDTLSKLEKEYKNGKITEEEYKTQSAAAKKSPIMEKNGSKRSPMRRLYVTLTNKKKLYMKQYYPFEWGSKDYDIKTLDMYDVEQQVLNLYHVESLEDLKNERRFVRA